MKKLISLLMALTIVVALAVPAGAASVTYNGKGLFQFKPGMELGFTSSDLFGAFKGVMPGDRRTETISITNSARNTDYIKVYMRAAPHGPGNDLSDGVKAAGETVDSMRDFLKWMELEVWNGNTRIYDEVPDASGELTDWTYLGRVDRGKSMEISAVLKVDEKMPSQDSESGAVYERRVGEVDWEFQVVEYVNDTPKTGDENDLAPYIALFTVSLAGMMFLLAAKKKKKA